MPFCADLSQLEKLYRSYGDAMFALCFLHAGGASSALSLMGVALCDISYSKGQWALAQRGKEGFLRAVHNSCMDYYLKSPKKRNPPKKKKKKDGEAPAHVAPAPTMPFTLTEPLRRALALPASYKGPLYLRLGLGLSNEEAALALGSRPNRIDARLQVAVKKTALSEEALKSGLSSLRLGEDGLDRVWERFLVDREEESFAGKQRLRRVKLFMDNAVPYIALLVIALGAFAYFGVENGWFTGTPYSETAPVEGFAPSGYYGSQPEEEASLPISTLSVFVPEEASFALYNVTDTPISAANVVTQMVYLGGLPEGASLLSVSLSPEGDLPAAQALTIELSREAAEYFAASPGEAEPMLRAMTATFTALCPSLTHLSFVSNGEELAANSLTAQSLLSDTISPSRTTDTPYRP